MVVGPLINSHFKHNSFVVIGDQLIVAIGLINFIFKLHKLLSIGTTTTKQR
jgi:hypothetical protein